MIVGFITFLVWWANGFPLIHYGSDYFWWFAVSACWACYTLGHAAGKRDAKSS